MNNKAQMACRTMFQLTHSHGDILRDGWKNILDCIVQLYKANLLPKVLVEVYFFNCSILFDFSLMPIQIINKYFNRVY